MRAARQTVNADQRDAPVTQTPPQMPIGPLGPLAGGMASQADASASPGDVFAQPTTDAEAIDAVWGLQTAQADAQRQRATATLGDVLDRLVPLLLGHVPPETARRAQLGQQLLDALADLRPLSDGVSKDDLNTLITFLATERDASALPIDTRRRLAGLQGQLAQLWTTARTGAASPRADAVLRQLLMS